MGFETHGVLPQTPTGVTNGTRSNRKNRNPNLGEGPRPRSVDGSTQPLSNGMHATFYPVSIPRGYGNSILGYPFPYKEGKYRTQYVGRGSYGTAQLSKIVYIFEVSQVIYFPSFLFSCMHMHDSNPTRRAVLKVAGISSGALLGASGVFGSTSAAHNPTTCRPEPGLQGQVPLQYQPTRTDAYCRNIELVGHNSIENRGANYDMVWYGDYAYLNTAWGNNPNDGTAVIDASNPQDPTVTTIIQRNSFECMAVSESRDLLILGCAGKLVLFDLADPAHPEELSITDIPISGVIPALSPDDTIVYISRFNPFITEDINKTRGTANPGMAAIDISDPLEPKVVATHPDDGHAPGISLDGKKLYLGDHGVTVYDISEIQQGEDNPEYHAF